MVILLVAFAAVSGCDLPRDPQGTLDRVRSGTMRVGVIDQPPFADFEDGKPMGIEVTLVNDLAKQLGATVQWTRGGEQHLFEKLERFELDLVVGGVTQSSPWSTRLGMTLPHLVETRDDRQRVHVFAVPPGENAWLVRVDRFLFNHRDESMRLFERANRKPSKQPGAPADAPGAQAP